MSHVQPQRFLLATWDGGGVIPPQLGLMKRLVAQGHEVRVLCDPTVKDEAIAAGCSFSSWSTAPHRESRLKEDDILMDYAKSKPQHLKDMMRDFFADPIPRWTADVLREIDAFSPDAVVADSFLAGALVAAEARGVPSIALCTTPYGMPAEGIAPMGMGLTPGTNALTRARDRLLHAVGEKLMWNKALVPLNATRAQHGLAPLTRFLAQLDGADRMLVLTSAAFDFTSPHVPKNVRWVGAQLDDPTWAEPWRSPWPASDTRPLVLVGLSSTYMAQVPLLNRIVAALSALPVRGVVTLGPTIAAHEVPGRDNVHVVPSAPHGELLKHAALVITHCGHGTTIKTAAAGVPMVCVPMGRDQSDNATRVVSRGAGVLMKTSADAATIQRVVQHALSNAAMRVAAQRLSRAIVEEDAKEDAVGEIVAVAASRRSPSQARAA